jgi:hypothetical protein
MSVLVTVEPVLIVTVFSEPRSTQLLPILTCPMSVMKWSGLTSWVVIVTTCDDLSHTPSMVRSTSGLANARLAPMNRARQPNTTPLRTTFSRAFI